MEPKACPKCGHKEFSARYHERGRTIMKNGFADPMDNDGDQFEVYGPYECLNPKCKHEWDDE